MYKPPGGVNDPQGAVNDPQGGVNGPQGGVNDPQGAGPAATWQARIRISSQKMDFGDKMYILSDFL